MDEPNDDALVVPAAGVKPRWGRTTDRRWVRWSRKMKAAFLDHLAATCNVCASAEAIGVDPGSIYTLRRRDAVFAAGWADALAAGYEMLETRLVGHALAGGGVRTVAGDGVVDAVDVDLALKLLGTHRGAMLGKRSTGGRRPHVATREETNAAILRKLRYVRDRAAKAVGDDAPVATGDAATGEAKAAPDDAA